MDNKIISPQQFDFPGKYGTIEQVDGIISGIRSELENRKYCSAVFLDVAQAKVLHEGLISTIKKRHEISELFLLEYKVRVKAAYLASTSLKLESFKAMIETKCYQVTISLKRQNCAKISINGAITPLQNEVLYLGLHLYMRLTWIKHLEMKMMQIKPKLNAKNIN